jgi:hypothetical protein
MSRAIDGLIPVPQQVEELGGSVDVGGKYWLVDRDSARDHAIRCKLSEELGVRWGVSLSLPANTVTVGSPPQAEVRPPDRAEGYVLHAGADGLAVRGRDASGLYWGLVTLEHLLGDGTDVPCVRVEDWPAIALRGHHDDISRKQVSRLSDFRRIIRLLSRYKINVYTPYMEDMLFLESYPDIGEGRGRLTPGEVQEIHREARRHNVLVIPTYSLIGHQENLLANPKYAHLGCRVFQAMSSFDTARPEVREFLRGVIRDVCAMFPAPYFHACFDETQGIGTEEFLAHANWCAAQLAAYGKQMPMWVDMLYNHFGCEMIGRLAENVIPVNWQYDCLDDQEVPHQRELLAQGRPVWGLAAYRNWSSFLPDVSKGRSNIDCWRRAAVETGTPALFASQWGDEGYENHRDMCWDLFAYLGEAAWSGERARRSDFERRFQLSFYGSELPELTELIEDLPGSLSLRPREFWVHFRRNAYAMARWAVQNPGAGIGLAEDERRIAAALETVESLRGRACRERQHLDHYRVSLLRMLSVVHRMRFALDRAGGMDAEDCRRRAAQVREELETVRHAYEADWLRTNKRPNVEVSLRVYEEVLPTYEALPNVAPGEPGRRDGYYVLDLSGCFSETFLPVGGIPIGESTVNGVPFLFAGEDRTHVVLRPDEAPVEVALPQLPVADVHMIVAAPRTDDGPEPVAVLELLSSGTVVHSEELLSIAHLCDWWAPLGEHIWAGGGMAHVDADRVSYGLRPGHLYGLAHLRGFGVSGSAAPDALRMRVTGSVEVRLFAVTLGLVTTGPGG